MATVESRDISCGQFLQGQEVQVVRQRPQDRERCSPLHEKFESHPIFPKEPAALPVREKHHGRDGEVMSRRLETFVCPFQSCYQEDHVGGWKSWLLSYPFPYGQSGGLTFFPVECKKLQGL